MNVFADYSNRIAPLAPVGPFDERNKIAKNLTLIRHAWIGPCNFLEPDFRGVRGCTSTNRAFLAQVDYFRVTDSPLDCQW